VRRALVLLALAACEGDEPGAGTPDAATAASDAPRAADAPPDAPPAAPDAPPGITLARCTGRAFPAQTAEGFEHLGSEIIAATGAEHAAADALVIGGGAVVAGAKFQYGAPIFKDLEDERVRVYRDDCQGWQLVDERTTDGDGRISTDLGALPYGVYDLRYVVAGDATVAPARLWVLPVGTQLTIFDIDGTLTTSDFEIVHDLLADLATGDYVPEAYPSAAALTRAHRDIGMIGVYITGRPYWLTRITREWLDALDFAPGPLFLARDNLEALPTEAGVGTFKRELISGLAAAGFVLDSAQGNATTDIYAYLGAGIAAARVWIIGPHAGEEGTNAVNGSWAAHAAGVAARPRVAQPFE
jgi:hypothetical protein